MFKGGLSSPHKPYVFARGEVSCLFARPAVGKAFWGAHKWRESSPVNHIRFPSLLQETERRQGDRGLALKPLLFFCDFPQPPKRQVLLPLLSPFRKPLPQSLAQQPKTFALLPQLEISPAGNFPFQC